MADLDLLPTPDLLASLLDHNAQAVAAVGPGDVVAGVVASGGTPFVLGACRGAARWPDDRHRLRAGSPLAALADLPILLDVGPEALLGSTRLKAGTAQEIAPNMISTGVMARLGYVYGDLLVGRGPPMPSCAPAPARPRRRHPRHPHRPGSRCGRGATGPLRPRCADGATVRQAGLGTRGGIGPAGGGWGRRPPGTGRALTRPLRAGIVAPRLDWLPLDAGRSLQHAVVLYLAAQSTRHSR